MSLVKKTTQFANGYAAGLKKAKPLIDALEDIIGTPDWHEKVLPGLNKETLMAYMECDRRIAQEALDEFNKGNV